MKQSYNQERAKLFSANIKHSKVKLIFHKITNEQLANDYQSQLLKIFQ